jgi:excisionase family DNA binding protein
MLPSCPVPFTRRPQRAKTNLDYKYLTRDEAADYLRVSVATIARAIAQKRIAVVRIGRRVVFTFEALDAFARGEWGVPDSSGADVETAAAELQTAE